MHKAIKPHPVSGQRTVFFCALMVALCFLVPAVRAQDLLATTTPPPTLVDAPEPQTGGQPGAPAFTGTVTDTDGLVVPGATIAISLLEGEPHETRTVQSGPDGHFVVSGVRPSVNYRLVISAKGFADFNLASVMLGPADNSYEIPHIKLAPASVDTTI